MVYDLLMQRDADGRLLDFLQQLLHEVTNLLSETSVVKSNYSSPWSTSQKSNKNLSKIFKNVRRHSKEWIAKMSQEEMCRPYQERWSRGSERAPSNTHNLAVSYRDNQVQLMKNNYDNYLSRANTQLHVLAGMLLKLIWKL